MSRIYVFGLLLCGVVIGVFWNASFAYAVGPQFLVSWKPQVYAPVWYEGKLFPVKDSVVRVSFEMVDQNAPDQGKVIDLSNSEVRWYVGGELVRKGIGLQSLAIKNNLFSGDAIEVKIAADFFDSQTGERYFAEKYVSIPVVDRQLLLVRRAMGDTFAPHAQATWYAVPLFFSSAPQNLALTWTVNGQTVQPISGNPFSLTIQSGDSGQTADIQVSLTNPASLWENASAYERIYIK